MTTRMQWLSETYDLPKTDTTLTYAIATHMRAGSTYLCKQLWETGDLGAPFEYNIYNVARWRQDNVPECDNSIDYEKLKSYRTGHNGVFGTKIITSLPKYKFDKWIYLYRKDALARAVSEVIAIQTDAYMSTDAEIQAPVYDELAIINAITRDKHSSNIWKYFFESENITPLTIEYDEISNSVEKIAEFLGVKLTLDHIVDNLPDMQKQSSSINDDWVAKAKQSSNISTIL